MAKKRRASTAPRSGARSDSASPAHSPAAGAVRESGARRPIALWLLALAIAALGFVPLANVIHVGSELTWWRAALLQGTARPAFPLLPWWGIVLGLSAALAVTMRSRLDVVVARVNQAILAPRPGQFATAIAALSFTLAAVVSWYCFRGEPFQGDEFSQWFQVRLLLSRHLAGVPEAYREFFSTAETFDLGRRWFSQFPIGGAAFLAVGAVFHAAWLVNPVLMGWTARNVYRFASNVGDESLARWMGLLFAVTPFAVLTAATQMNHAATLAFLTWGLSVLPTWTASTDDATIRRSAAILGLSFSIAATVRPFDAALCAVVVGGFQLVYARHSPARRRAFIWQVAAGALPVAILLYANWHTTGSPLLFGYDALNGPEHHPGFHIDPHGRDHTPLRGLLYTSAYLFHLQYALFQGPIPALVLIVGGLALATVATRWDYLQAGIIIIVLVGYLTYWHDGYLLTAPRFLHAALPAFVWFAVRGLRALAGTPQAFVRRTAILVMPMCMLLAWCAPNNPYRYFGVWTVAGVFRTPADRPRIDVAADARNAGLTNALVLVRESWHGSLAARFRALGAPPLLTEDFVPSVDACALQTALDAVPPGTESMEAIQWVVAQSRSAGQPTLVPGREGKRDSYLGLVPGRPLTPDCQRELDLDNTPAIPFAYVQTDADFDREGRIGGNIVFARDLGPRDTLLRARFSDRRWYRYQVVPGTARGQFIPIK